MTRRIAYDIDLLHGGGWVLWRAVAHRLPRVVAEGRFRPVGGLMYWHRRLLRSRLPAPPPRLDLFGCDHDPRVLGRIRRCPHPRP